METQSKYQGIIWEKGLYPGCIFFFPLDSDIQFCVGTDYEEGPTLLIESQSHIYFLASSAKTGDVHDYIVIRNFDGPFSHAHSGDRFHCGDQTFRLL